MRIPDQYDRDEWKYNSRELPKWDRENGCLGEDGAKTFQDLKRAYMKKTSIFLFPFTFTNSSYVLSHQFLIGHSFVLM